MLFKLRSTCPEARCTVRRSRIEKHQISPAANLISFHRTRECPDTDVHHSICLTRVVRVHTTTTHRNLRRISTRTLRMKPPNNAPNTLSLFPSISLHYVLFIRPAEQGSTRTRQRSGPAPTRRCTSIASWTRRQKGPFLS